VHAQETQDRISIPRALFVIEYARKRWEKERRASRTWKEMLVPDVLKLRALLHRGASPDLFTLWNFYSLRAGPPRAFAAPNRHTSLELLCAQGTMGHPWNFSDSSTASLEIFPCRQYFSNSKILRNSTFLQNCRLTVAPTPIHLEQRINTWSFPVDINKLIHDTVFFSMRYIPQKR